MSLHNIQKSKIVNVKFGKNVKIIDPVNLYECFIEDDVFIGPFVEIQSNVRVKSKTRIQSHSFICDGVTINSNCFIAHGVMFTNDDFKNGGPSGKENLKKTVIGSYVSIGSNTTILPVKICDRVVIGAGSVVTKDILKPGFYAGNPIKFLRKI